MKEYNNFHSHIKKKALKRVYLTFLNTIYFKQLKCKDYFGLTTYPKDLQNIFYTSKDQ